MLLRKEFSFDAAHRLEQYHGKCEALHGHTYRVAVTLKGTPDEEGMVFDFTQLKRVAGQEAIDRLDHSYLNDLMGQPTAENIALWIWHRIEEKLRRPSCELHTIQVWETATSSVIIDRDDVR